MNANFFLFLLLAIIACNTLFSQDRKKVTENIGDRRSGTKEIYYVSADGSVKDGSYELIHNGKTRKTGFYKLGKKDSVWESYNNKNVLVARKRYIDGKKAGIWEFYNGTGELDWTYDFNLGTAAHQPNYVDITHISYQDENGNWINGHPDKDPIDLQGKSEWLVFLLYNLHYPDDAVNNEQMGDVGISITIDENGNAIDYSVVQSAAPSLDAEGLRVAKPFFTEFVPAEKNGKKVKSRIIRFVKFRIEVSK
jgi:TonB family protein